MAQIFHRSTNTLSRVTIFGAVFFIAFVLYSFLMVQIYQLEKMQTLASRLRASLE